MALWTFCCLYSDQLLKSPLELIVVQYNFWHVQLSWYIWWLIDCPAPFKSTTICKHVGQLLTGRNVCLMSDSEFLLDRCVSLDLLENKRNLSLFFEKYNVSNQPFVSKFFGHIQSLNSPFIQNDCVEEQLLGKVRFSRGAIILGERTIIFFVTQSSALWI